MKTVHFSHSFKSYGHWTLTAEVSLDLTKLDSSLKPASTVLTSTITDSEFIDEVQQLKDDGATTEEIQAKYNEKYYLFEDRIEAFTSEEIPLPFEYK